MTGANFRQTAFGCGHGAGLKTSNGEVFARSAPEVSGHDGKSKVLQLSCPRWIDGKPLISIVHESRISFGREPESFRDYLLHQCQRCPSWEREIIISAIGIDWFKGDGAEITCRIRILG
jgi:hypothetical protein